MCLSSHMRSKGGGEWVGREIQKISKKSGNQNKIELAYYASFVCQTEVIVPCNLQANW